MRTPWRPSSASPTGSIDPGRRAAAARSSPLSRRRKYPLRRLRAVALLPHGSIPPDLRKTLSSRDDTVKEIVAANAAFYDAFVNRDLAAMESLWAEQAAIA